MKLSMSNIAWTPEERGAAYSALAGAGLTGLEIAPALFFHAAEDPFNPDPAVARTAMTEIAEAGLSLVSMQSLLFGVSGAGLFEGAEARAAFEAGMIRAIGLAGRFGIPNLVFGSPRQRRVPEDMAMEQAFDEAAEVFQRLGDAAQRADTVIAVEANPEAYDTNFLTTLTAVTGFVKRADHPAIVTILDLGAIHMNGTCDCLPAILPSLMPHLNHVHVSEPNLAPAPAETQALVPVLRALQAQGYDRAISIEMKRPDTGLRGVEAALCRLVTACKAAGADHV
ncbi:sugar phosphate isomerase/epimerase family protein [Pseudooceanicola onchidii]|uniref:sugar phosphate isomerase/epimerase family protein n=1 Tax=Pseudooceanicola onchidii TaxID=2562279 RepID=UPI0010AA34F2|nr:TIM barrel protein [Pseudooceanicola onchidii]